MSSQASSDGNYLPGDDDIGGDWIDEDDEEDEDDELDLEDLIRMRAAAEADMLEEMEDDEDEEEEEDEYEDDDDGEGFILDDEAIRVLTCEYERTRRGGMIGPVELRLWDSGRGFVEMRAGGDREDTEELWREGRKAKICSREVRSLEEAMSGSTGGSILEQLRLLTSRSNSARLNQPAPPEPIPTNYYPPVVEAEPKGLALRFGGEFGNVKKRGIGSGLIWEREKGAKWGRKSDYGKECVPNTDGTVVANLTAPPYCGQYSSDSSFFYTATKDFRMSLFSTSASPVLARPPLGPLPPRRRYYNAFGEMEADEYESPSGGRVGESSLPVVKSFQGVEGGWTVTDADLGIDDDWMIYSSMTNQVQLFRTRDASEEQVTLDFSSPSAGRRYRNDDLRIFSVRFSADGKEIVAGGTGGYDGVGKIVVFDIETKRPTLSIDCHENDVNSVCWADRGSKHLLCSASDDGYVKVWDRRSLSSGKPSGVLVGHTEGITSVSAKGDGRYILSNGKDQSCRLWDLRSMASSSVCDNVPDAAHRWGTGYDYRNGVYSKPKYQKAPGDCSVMTYRGHSVVRTLIRCHFAPENSTGQQYIYSGSADGRIHVWNLDGRVAQVLDRRFSAPLIDTSLEGVYSDPSAPDSSSSAPAPAASSGGGGGGGARYHGGRVPRRGLEYCVRDVSWHGYKPEMISAAWDPSGRGSLAKHEWKGFGKHAMTIEDVNLRESQEMEL